LLCGPGGEVGEQDASGWASSAPRLNVRSPPRTTQVGSGQSAAWAPSCLPDSHRLSQHNTSLINFLISSWTTACVRSRSSVGFVPLMVACCCAVAPRTSTKRGLFFSTQLFVGGNLLPALCEVLPEEHRDPFATRQASHIAIPPSAVDKVRSASSNFSIQRTRP
jgi:hypothetical protein